MKEIFLSSCRLFRATRASKKTSRKHIEYKVSRRSTDECVGFIYFIDNWVFDPLLTPFTATELMDMASLLSAVRQAITGLKEN